MKKIHQELKNTQASHPISLRLNLRSQLSTTIL